MKSTYLLLFFTLITYLTLACGISFYLRNDGNTKCFVDSFPTDSIVTGNIEITPPIQGRALWTRISEGERTVYENSNMYEKATFGFTAVEHGDYSFCFKDVGNDGAPTRLVTIKFLSESEALKKQKYEDIAKREQLKPIEVQLRIAEDLANTLHKEFSEMKEHEKEHRDTSESINTRVQNYSMLSLIIVAALGIWQVIYLRRYFKAKKIID